MWVCRALFYPHKKIIMSTAHRPTWKAKSGGGGLRDGSTAPPTLQHSSKDQVAHSKLKHIRPAIATPDSFASFFSSPQSEELSLQDEDHHAHQHPPPLNTDSESDEEAEWENEDDEDDEAELLAELEKIRAERKAKETAMQQANPLLPSSTTLIKGRWEEEGVVFKRPSMSKDKEKEKKKFINDTIRSDYHRSFIDKFVK